MRAYTIVLFILAIHACLAMFNVANITDIGLNVSLDTSSKTGFILIPPGSAPIIPSSNPQFFDQCATGQNITNGSSLLGKNDFSGGMIESIIGVGTAFSKFIRMASSVVFSIYTLSAPIFGSYNAMILEGIVDVVLGVAIFQMVTGRSFKTME